ncbi:formin-like protein 5 [Vulpes lagopus]|uniref:formin-like protein 5 n=1 Tax=Vulpes lagopus TaxID=494514 RepID=UPI001BC99AFC|nr:formin-like protein 5 [Vulpes lagopus]
MAPSAQNVGSQRSRFWRHLPLPSSRESPPRRRGRLRPTSSLPPSPFSSFPPAASPLLLPPPPPTFPHPVCVPLPLRLAGRLGRPRPEKEAGAQAAAATRGCGGERDPRPRGGPASGHGTRGLPVHPQPRAAGPGLAAGWRRDTSSCLSILRTPSPPAGRCFLKALSLELHFLGL